MKRTLAVAVVVVGLAVCGSVNSVPLSPNVAHRADAGDVFSLVVKAHHKPSHVGGRGRHLGWFKKNRGKHKGWRR